MKRINFTTIAELKRQATNERYMRGGYYGKNQESWRKIVGTQTNGLYLYDGQTRSFFEFPKAKNSEIKDGKLYIFEDRVKFENSDVPANTSWLKWGLERGKIAESELTRYRKQVAEYELGEED